MKKEKCDAIHGQLIYKCICYSAVRANIHKDRDRKEQSTGKASYRGSHSDPAWNGRNEGTAGEMHYSSPSDEVGIVLVTVDRPTQQLMAAIVTRVNAARKSGCASISHAGNTVLARLWSTS